MIITKKKIARILVFCLTLSIILLMPLKISAAGDPANTPLNWAFEPSSVALNDAMVLQYPELDNGDGFVTIPSANNFTDDIDLLEKALLVM